MKFVISDSSTLILLAKSNLLKLCIDIFDIIIPDIVYKEILKGKEKNYKDAFKIESFIKNKKIKIENPKNKTIEQYRNLFALDSGELYALCLAKEKNKDVLIDDKKGINVCCILNIKFYTSLNILLLLYDLNKISKNKALENLDLLNYFGRFSLLDIQKIKEKIDGNL
jgi:predicted nucleic acid-binding protein